MNLSSFLGLSATVLLTGSAVHASQAPQSPPSISTPQAAPPSPTQADPAPTRPHGGDGPRSTGAPSMGGLTSISSAGSTIQAAIAVLWDQPPADPVTTILIDEEFTDSASFSTYMVDDVSFGESVNITSVCTWYTNQTGNWPGAVTSARLNVFSGTSLTPADDPLAGTIVAVTATLDGAFVKLEAATDFDLPAGDHWIGLTPIASLGDLGQEFRVNTDPIVGQQSLLQNPGNGFGNGTDWQTGPEIFGAAPYDGSIRLTGAPIADCSTLCAPSTDQAPDYSQGAFFSDVTNSFSQAEDPYESWDNLSKLDKTFLSCANIKLEDIKTLQAKPLVLY